MARVAFLELLGEVGFDAIFGVVGVREDCGGEDGVEAHLGFVGGGGSIKVHFLGEGVSEGAEGDFGGGIGGEAGQGEEGEEGGGEDEVPG